MNGRHWQWLRGVAFDQAWWQSQAVVISWTVLYSGTAGIVRGRVCVMVLCPSVCPIYRSLQQRAVGLLLGHRQAILQAHRTAGAAAAWHTATAAQRSASRWTAANASSVTFAAAVELSTTSDFAPCPVLPPVI